jgi:hypothetical protein
MRTPNWSVRRLALTPALLLTASLSESVEGVKGLTTQQMLECLIAPDREAFTFQEAFEKLRSQAWYLHRKENDAWYFANVENLRKRIDNLPRGLRNRRWTRK